MNRIILIGNGFDLAHGLPTSYGHFMDWYWEQWLDVLKKSSKYKESDDLCELTLHYSSTWEDFLETKMSGEDHINAKKFLNDLKSDLAFSCVPNTNKTV